VVDHQLLGHQRAPFAQTHRVVPVAIKRSMRVVANHEATVTGGLQKRQNMHDRKQCGAVLIQDIDSGRVRARSHGAWTVLA